MPQIQVRRGTTAQWAAANPILAAGEPGYDITLALFKIGNGTLHWLDLPSQSPTGSGGGGVGLTKDPSTGMYAIGAGSSLSKDPSTGMYLIGA